MNTLETLFPRSRAQVLTLFMMNIGREFYLREVAHRTGLPVRAVQRELTRLTEAGILVRDDRGNRSYYTTNRQSPVVPDLRNLVLRTSAVADTLRESLALQDADISFAFVYGSFASGSETPRSDVDILVVGDRIDVHVINSWAMERETALGRRINYVILTVAEYEDRIRADDEFLHEVMANAKIMLIGDEPQTPATH